MDKKKRESTAIDGELNKKGVGLSAMWYKESKNNDPCSFLFL